MRASVRTLPMKDILTINTCGDTMSCCKRPQTKYYFYCENCGTEEGVFGDDDDDFAAYRAEFYRGRDEE